MALIAIEEHWNLPALTSAVKTLPEDRSDPSVLFDGMGDNLERLDDIGDARVAAMDVQSVDLQIPSRLSVTCGSNGSGNLSDPAWPYAAVPAVGAVHWRRLDG